MHFSTVSLVSALIALGGAIPTLTERSTNFCPGESHLTADIKCSSGFIGCATYEKASQICNGPKRFYNDCSGAPGLGSFFNCANGFKGCTTNPRICDNKSPPVTPEGCAAGSKWYICASNGFAGCSNDPRVCDSVTTPEPKRPDDCPAEQSYYGCAANGFRGCSADPHVCDAKSDPRPEPVPMPNPAPTCPKGTWYVKPDECTSGFVGCTGADSDRFQKLCGGEKQFWGSCPTGHGNYFHCANGFVGCTTDVGVCDK